MASSTPIKAMKYPSPSDAKSRHDRAVVSRDDAIIAIAHKSAATPADRSPYVCQRLELARHS
jgi:hypothetical protein